MRDTQYADAPVATSLLPQPHQTQSGVLPTTAVPWRRPAQGAAGRQLRPPAVVHPVRWHCVASSWRAPALQRDVLQQSRSPAAPRVAGQDPVHGGPSDRGPCAKGNLILNPCMLPAQAQRHRRRPAGGQGAGDRARHRARPGVPAPDAADPLRCEEPQRWATAAVVCSTLRHRAELNSPAGASPASMQLTGAAAGSVLGCNN